METPPGNNHIPADGESPYIVTMVDGSGATTIRSVTPPPGIVSMTMMPAAEYERIRREEELAHKPSFSDRPLPEGAGEYLRHDNPRLVELKEIYRSLRAPGAEHSRWSPGYVEREIDLARFRGDMAYVWQFRDRNTSIKYLITTYYIRQIDARRLLGRLGEDGLFGAHTFTFNDSITVSRDLLDSIAEIYFLERNLGIFERQGITMLDIGAGYGRLAHRLTQALPGLGHYYCVDSIAESTFISEYYLRFRDAGNASVIPLQKIEEVLARSPIELALNIHSFSECTAAAIAWWLDLLRKHRVRYLMIVPNAGDHNGTRLLSTERDGTRTDFLPIITSRGYRLIAHDPKYLDSSLQQWQHGVSPTHHYLFELDPA